MLTRTTTLCALAAVLAASVVGCKAKVEAKVGGAPPPPASSPPPPPPPAPPPKPKLEYITVSERIQFETGSAVLLERSKITLNEVVKVLNDNPHITLVEVGGHTDEVGTDADNLLLSENRAKSVVAYLVMQGIAANRLRFRGHGRSVPVAPNDTPAGREQNRRVEFRIVEQGQ